MTPMELSQQRRDDAIRDHERFQMDIARFSTPFSDHSQVVKPQIPKRSTLADSLWGLGVYAMRAQAEAAKLNRNTP